MRTVPHSGKKAAGRIALVDDEDYDLIEQYRWYVEERIFPSGSISGPYARTSIHVKHKYILVFMHIMITGWSQVDHKNHNGLDNQRKNLRQADNFQNQANRKRDFDSTSPYKGVTWSKTSGKWIARISIGGVRRSLGYFTDETEAAHAYDTAAAEAFGEYAWINFPQS